jgi:hypothetical protein
MKYLFIGICQLAAFSRVLQDYLDITNVTIFEISLVDYEKILQNLSEYDIVVSQPVSKTYKNNIIYSTYHLRQLCLQLNIPHYVMVNCYFTGYDPLAFQFTDLSHNFYRLANNSTHIPGICVESALTGNTYKTMQAWKGDYYTEKMIMDNLKKTIQNLKDREQRVFDDDDISVDITISDFIEENYQRAQLFHVYNHPSNVLLKELMYRMLKVINVNIDVGFPREELLGDDILPPCPKIMEVLKCTFPAPAFIINKRNYSEPAALYYYAEEVGKCDIKLKQQWAATMQEKKSALINE